MSRPNAILYIYLVTLIACAPGRSVVPSALHQSASESDVLSTGFHSPLGPEYTAAGDARVAKQVQELTPKNPDKPTVAESDKISFAQSLENFKFKRYEDSKCKGAASRFGIGCFEFQIQRKTKDNRSVLLNFSGTLTARGNSLVLNAKDESYTLEGVLRDATDKDASYGEFILRTKEHEATIDYRAFKAKPKARIDIEQEKTLSSELKRIAASLNEPDTYAWVMNFVVPMGVSKFHYDILKFTAATSDSPAISFTGDSINPESIDPVATSVESGTGVQQVTLDGEASNEDSRIFSMTVKDAHGESTKLMVDMERVGSAPESATPTTPDTNDVLTNTPPPAPGKVEGQSFTTPEQLAPSETPNASNEGSAESKSKPDQKETRTPAPPKTSGTPAAPKSSGSTPTQPPPPSAIRGENTGAYLASSPNLSRSSRIYEQIARSAHVQQVLDYEKTIISYPQMANMIFYGAPLRPMTEAISDHFDASVVWWYLNWNEGDFFKGHIVKSGRSSSYGGIYAPDINKKSTAVGAFQMLDKTAARFGLRVNTHRPGQDPGDSDERKYIAPESCATARYYAYLADFFPQDAALGISSFFKGEGRIRKLVENYGHNYKYDYPTMARNHMAGVKDAIDYTARTLAVYFVATEYKRIGFTIENAPSLSQTRYIFPRSEISDSECRKTVAPFKI